MGRHRAWAADADTTQRGSFLSKTFSARSFSTERGTKNFAAGQKVGCYDCHNGPDGD